MFDEPDRLPLMVRIPLELKAFISYRAAANHRNMTAEVAAVLRDLMQAEPPYAVVRECDVGDGKLFTATLGENLVDLYEGKSKEAAYVAARVKLKQLGFDPKNILFRDDA